MSTNLDDPLERLIRDTGEEWIFESFCPSGDAIATLRELLAEVDGRAKQRFGRTGPCIDEGLLVREYQRNPHKARAFVQALGTTSTPDMLLMAWRVLEGCSVRQVRLEYKQEEAFNLEITLDCPDGSASELYTSSSIEDAALLRHFGIMSLNGLPIFDGFYPF